MGKWLRTVPLVAMLALCMLALGSPALATAASETGNGAETMVLEIKGADDTPITQINLLGVEGTDDGGADIRFGLETAPIDALGAMNSALTRQEAATFMYRIIAGEGVDPTQWTASEITWTTGNGFINGDGTGVFSFGTDSEGNLRIGGGGDQTRGAILRMQTADGANLSNTVEFARDNAGALLPTVQTAVNGGMKMVSFNPKAALASTSGAITPVGAGTAIVMTEQNGVQSALELNVGANGAVNFAQPLNAVVLVDGQPAADATLRMDATASLGLQFLGGGEQAEKKAVYKTVLPRVLNVRAGTGTHYSKLGQLTRGTLVQVLEEVAGTAWSKIVYGDKDAYVQSKYIG